MPHFFYFQSMFVSLLSLEKCSLHFPLHRDTMFGLVQLACFGKAFLCCSFQEIGQTKHSTVVVEVSIRSAIFSEGFLVLQNPNEAKMSRREASASSMQVMCSKKGSSSLQANRSPLCCSCRHNLERESSMPTSL